ncbi:hypothetical protein [Rhodoblastus sp.]|uniref:hypothetical protein n=2 Tax=Rhodoblastus sp. TaxID=1962975 RepID=UPI003FD7A9C1
MVKTEVLEWFDKQERSYRLALLCTYWIRDTAPYKPSVSEAARGFLMEVHGQWLSFADLAEMLEQQSSRDALSSDFILNQLHALIRAPFGILEDYCKAYDKAGLTLCLWQKMQTTSWFQFTRIVRNAISHNFHFMYRPADRLPIAWNGITLSREMEGQPITYELWHKKGYELFLEMKAFAEALPEAPKAGAK